MWNKILTWILGIVAAIAALTIWVLRGRLEEAEIDGAKGRGEADRERLRDAEASGDEERVLTEWRRQR